MATGAAGKLAAAVKAVLLSPPYLLLAWLRGTPGIGLHLRIAATGARLLLRGRLAFRRCVGFMLFPMDSTRYFEFAEVWQSATASGFTRHLDVSSPRWLPLLLLEATPGATSDLINPDPADLAETRALAEAMGLGARVRFFGGLIQQAPYEPASFDLITCVSVLEHIPEDEAAVRTMWSLLRPGGRLLLTLPCMSAASEQFISHNQYGVLAAGADGYTFWQRYYDGGRLADCVYAVTGPAVRVAVYGEQRRGLFYRNATMKRLLGLRYPGWREPYMMAAEYRRFGSIEELPGEGVVMLEFVKPGGEP